MRAFQVPLTLIVLLLVLLVGLAMSQQVPADKVYIAYFTSWSIYARGFSPAQIPADKITHLLYAFAKIVNGRVALADSWADVEKAWRKSSLIWT